MFLFENLVVYKKSLSFVEFVYVLVKKWPKEELFSLTEQCKRAATSISLNIAEGNSRTSKDFRRFLDIARGSCFECLAIFSIAKNQHFIDDQQFRTLYIQLEELTKMIQGLKKSLL